MYDPVPVLAEFAARRGITFPLLSDAGSPTIKRYGILNTTVPESNQLYGYPFPGTFILNRDGNVTARFFEPTYQERNTISSVLVRLGKNVAAPATKTTAPYLEITSYLTDPVAAPGTRFSIVLDVKPESQVHVYAPGVTGYKPIAFAVQPQPGLVVRETHFPKAEDYYFKPLNEHVPELPEERNCTSLRREHDRQRNGSRPRGRLSTVEHRPVAVVFRFHTHGISSPRSVVDVIDRVRIT